MIQAKTKDKSGMESEFFPHDENFSIQAERESKFFLQTELATLLNREFGFLSGHPFQAALECVRSLTCNLDKRSVIIILSSFRSGYFFNFEAAFLKQLKFLFMNFGWFVH